MFGTVSHILPVSAAGTLLSSLTSQLSADGVVLIGILGAALAVRGVWRLLTEFTAVGRWMSDREYERYKNDPEHVFEYGDAADRASDYNAQFDDESRFDSDAGLFEEGERKLKRLHDAERENDRLMRKVRGDW